MAFGHQLVGVAASGDVQSVQSEVVDDEQINGDALAEPDFAVVIEGGWRRVLSIWSDRRARLE
jgi:hypothetical protein